MGALGAPGQPCHLFVNCNAGSPFLRSRRCRPGSPLSEDGCSSWVWSAGSLAASACTQVRALCPAMEHCEQCLMLLVGGI